GGGGGGGDLLDLLGGDEAPAAAAAPATQKTPVLNPSQPGQGGRSGFGVMSALVREQGQLLLKMTFSNSSPGPLNGFAIQVNKNTFGIDKAANLQVPDIAPGTSAEVVLQMAAGQNLSGTAPTNPLFLQVAIKNSLDIFYFNVPFDLSVALVESGAIGRDQFTGIWQRVGEAGQHTTTINVDRPINAETARSRLTPGNVHYVAQRQVDEQTVRMYLSAATTNNCAILAEVEVRSSATSVQIVTRTETPVLVPLFEAAVSKRLSGR
ncbi:unnamed protein product, partial [Prorocentrum cordatum]